MESERFTKLHGRRRRGSNTNTDIYFVAYVAGCLTILKSSRIQSGDTIEFAGSMRECEEYIKVEETISVNA